MRVLKTALILAVWCAISLGVRPVYAYLDPGTGSFVFQILIGVIVGAGFLIKTYWNKIISLFKKREETDELGE